MKAEKEHKQSILIADDEQDFLDLFKNLFEKNGYDVRTVKKGSEIISQIKQKKPDIVLLDVILDEGISGFDILKEIKSNNELKYVFVVLISSHEIESEIQSKGLEAGADGYLTKPIRNRELLARVNAFMRHKITIDRLINSEERFRKISEKNADGFIIIDQNGIIHYANPACEVIFEKNKEDIVGHMFGYPIIKNQTAEISIKSRQGFDKIAEMRVVEIIWEEEKMLLASLRDITERTISEKLVESSKNKYLSLYQATSDAILLANDEGQYVDVNDAALELFGYTRDEFLNLSYHDITPHSNLEDGKRMWQQFMEMEEMEGEYTILTKDKQVVSTYFKAAANVQDGLHMSVIRDITEIKRYQDQLLKEKKRAESYLEVSGVIFISLNRRQEIVLANKKSQEMLGFSEEELLGKNWFDHFIPRSHTEEVKDVFNNIMQGDIEPVEYHENPVICKGGELRTILWHNSLLFDDNKNIIGLLSSGNDITDLKKTEKELLESEKRYRNIFEQSLDGIFMHDMEGVLLDVNNSVCKILSAKKEDLIGKSIFEYHTKEALKIAKKAEINLKTKGFAKINLTLKNSKNHEFLAEVWTTIIIDGDKQYIQGIVRDITYEKEIEDALIESEKKYRTYIDAAPQGVFIADETGRYIDVNNSACDLLGYSEKELLQKSIKDITYEKDVNKALNGFLELKKKKKLKIEHRYVTKSGDVKWWMVSAVELYNKRYLAFTTDIQEQKEIEDELNQYKGELEKIVSERTKQLELKNKRLTESQKAMAFLIDDANEARNQLVDSNRQLSIANEDLESFAYSVSHDLKSPLRAINGYANVLIEDFADIFTGEKHEYMTNIIRNTKQMNKLIDDLLRFSRDGRSDLDKSRFNLSALVNDVIKGIKENYKEHKLNVKIQEDLFVQADISAMKQVMENIIGNAFKFSKLKDEIYIEFGAIQEDNQMNYLIKDKGAGFEPSYAEKIFGVFQRLHSGDQFEGTGVGLALVKRIILKHGGLVWAETELNKGTSIYFNLGKAPS
jgi:PAS domain S-box-containing protein